MNNSLLEIYRRDGVVKVPTLFSAAEMREIRREIERYLTEIVLTLAEGDYVLEADGRSIRNCWRMEHHDSFFAGLAHREDLQEWAGACVQGEPVLLGVETFNKPALVGSGVPPHQDNAYFCLEPADAVTMWIAVDPVTEENGPVYYHAGSHCFGTHSHARSGVAGNSMGLSEVPACASPFVGLLAPGDALLHHAQTVHYSAANTSSQSRCGLLLVFKAAHCQSSPALRMLYTGSSV